MVIIYYFIFGKEATEIIHRVSFKYFLDNCLDIDHEAVEFEDGDDPRKLLDISMDWYDYYSMDKEEWDSYEKKMIK